MEFKASSVSRLSTLSTPWGEVNMTPSTESVVVFADALTHLEPGDIVAAFNQNGVVCGMMEIANSGRNHSLILFGDDPTTLEADGFEDGENISFKLHRASTGEVFELNVAYKSSMDNSTGLFYSDSFAGITNMTTGITSIDEMNNNGVSLYPNPAKDVITIEFATELNSSTKVSIFNAQGHIVKQEIVKYSQSQLNIGGMNQGIYFVRIQNAAFNKTMKLIIE
jgi:hypothetical protein